MHMFPTPCGLFKNSNHRYAHAEVTQSACLCPHRRPGAAAAAVCCLQVVEVGQVGTLQRPTPSSGAAASLFVHSQKGGSFGDASTIVSALSDAAQQEAAAAQVRDATNSTRALQH
jgi:hypothetical protein